MRCTQTIFKRKGYLLGRLTWKVSICYLKWRREGRIPAQVQFEKKSEMRMFMSPRELE